MIVGFAVFQTVAAMPGVSKKPKAIPHYVFLAALELK